MRYDSWIIFFYNFKYINIFFFFFDGKIYVFNSYLSHYKWLVFIEYLIHFYNLIAIIWYSMAHSCEYESNSSILMEFRWLVNRIDKLFRFLYVLCSRYLIIKFLVFDYTSTSRTPTHSQHSKIKLIYTYFNYSNPSFAILVDTSPISLDLVTTVYLNC